MKYRSPAVLAVLLLLAGCEAMESARDQADLQKADLGFNYEGVVLATVQAETALSPDAQSPDALTQRHEDLLARFEALPGVVSAALARNVPLTEPSLRRSGFVTEISEMSLEPGTSVDPEAGFEAFVNSISPRYFETLGIPLLAGRSFTPVDDRESVPVAIVSETMTVRFWPEGSALGQRIWISPGDAWTVIVGVVANVEHGSLDSTGFLQIYRPASQDPPNPCQVVVRAEVEALALIPAMQAMIDGLEGLDHEEMTTLEERILAGIRSTPKNPFARP